MYIYRLNDELLAPNIQKPNNNKKHITHSNIPYQILLRALGRFSFNFRGHLVL